MKGLKRAVVVADRYKEGEIVRAIFLSKHGREYMVAVVTKAQALMGHRADLYIICPGIDYDLFKMTYERAARNDAPVHRASAYTIDTKGN
jgi:hypothetical protein